ncbi:enoyl-CoA hydratase/isomerase family protein [Nocardioidaceae bacterium]|nr:enoyl-CoA hydratase/isomerase family protein [Nocardioidaceae bacterium]
MTNHDAPVLIDHADGILRLTMNRPEVMNAFSPDLNDTVAGELEAATARDDVRVVLLTGSGPAFSAGADLAAPGGTAAFDDSTMEHANRLIRAVVGCDKPVVAGVNGVAAGVGTALALACDLQVCTESAGLVMGFAAIGLMPDGGTSATVPAAMGRARAMRMALLSEMLSAREAYDAGLVSHCVPDTDYASTLDTVLAKLAAGPPLSLAATKKAVNAAAVPELNAALERERSGQVVLMRTDDFAEGVAAFTGKRRPAFGGS